MFINSKFLKRGTALSLALALSVNSLTPVSATEHDKLEETSNFVDNTTEELSDAPIQSAEETSDIVADVAGVDDMNTEVYSTDENVLIADGYEMLLEVPLNSDEAIQMSDGMGEDICFYLPEEVSEMEPVLTEEGIVVYSNEENDTSFGVQALQLVGSNEEVIEGVRTTIIIDNASAPNSYVFSYELETGQRIVSAAEYLGEEYDTGEIYIVNDSNEIMYIIDKPWAKDANGMELNTYYTIEGNSICQTIDFNEETVFPVVADPSAWQVTKCVGSLAWLVGSTIFAATKIVKIKKYIKALGGLKEAAALLVGATSVAEKSSSVATTLLSLAATISGVDSVYTNCKIGSAIKKIKKRLKR